MFPMLIAINEEFSFLSLSKHGAEEQGAARKGKQDEIFLFHPILFPLIVFIYG